MRYEIIGTAIGLAGVTRWLHGTAETETEALAEIHRAQELERAKGGHLRHSRSVVYGCPQLAKSDDEPL